MTDAPSEPRAPGLWVPYVVIGFIIPILTFAAAFIGTVRVLERHLAEVDARLARLDRIEDEAAVDRREFAVRLGRIEGGAPDGRGRP